MEDAVVAAHGVGFSYDRPVLEGFDLEARAGSITLLLGLNGAGKTTALRLLSGQVRPGEGRVRILDGDPLKARVRRNLFHLPEESDPPRHLKALEVLRFHLDLFGRPRMDRPALMDLLARVGLKDVARKRVAVFSKGMRRRLELVCLVAVDPPVWLLDEPQSGLDPEGLRLLRRLCLEARERGRTVVMATHALGDVRELADAILLLQAGRTIFSGDRRELLQRTGGREFVLEGGGEDLDREILEAARRHGAVVRGPLPAADLLEEFFFKEERPAP